MTTSGTIGKKGRSKKRIFDQAAFFPGLRYGNLVLVSVTRLVRKNGQSVPAWKCRCDCVTEVTRTPCQIHDKQQPSCYPCGMRRRTIPLEEAAVDRIFARYQRQAEERRLDFNLVREDLSGLIRQPCFYCGSLGSNRFVKSSREPRFADAFVYNGLDRLNNSLGYEIKNVVACCKTCNSAKSVMSSDAFLTLVQRIYEHRIAPGTTPDVTIL